MRSDITPDAGWGRLKQTMKGFLTRPNLDGEIGRIRGHVLSGGLGGKTLHLEKP